MSAQDPTTDVGATAVELDAAFDAALGATAPGGSIGTAEAALAPSGGMARPLRIRDFRLLFSGESVSLLGDQFHFVALAWLALQLTGSGLALGTVLMTAAIPRAVFMLVGGALSDRMSPRTLMLVSNALRSVVVGVLAGLVLTGHAELWHLYVLAAIFGVVDAIFHPALNTILPMLVPDRDLAPANALMQGAMQLTGLVGPAMAGLLVAAVQTGPAFAIDAVSFAVAATALVLIRGGRRTATHEPGDGGPEQTGMVATIGAGLRYAWSDPAIRALLLLTAAFNLAFAGPVNVGLAWLADNRFAGASATFGLLLSTFGAGALVGAIVAGSVRPPQRLGLVVLSIAAIMGAAMTPIGWAPVAIAVAPALVVIGVGAGFINVHVMAWLQARTAPDMRGRVMGLVMLGSMGLFPVSLAVAGVLVDLGAISVMFAAAGLLILASVAAAFAWGVPDRMRADR
jgi:MFS family permease